jgi:DNA adenine methylase
MQCAADGCTNTIEKPATGRPGKYCSARCRKRAERERKAINIVTKQDIRHETINKPAPVLKYPGAKWLIGQWIVSQFPTHKIYVEPFFGSGACFFNKAPSEYEVINDLSDQVVNLFKMIRERGEELAYLIDMTPWSRSEYYESYTTTGDPLEDARRFLVRCWQAHSTKTSERTGWMNRGASAGGSTVNRWKKVPARLLATTDRLKDAEIEHIPGVDLIQRFQDAEDCLIYCDPPYVLQTRHGRMYEHEMNNSEHEALLDALERCKGYVILSGYAHPLYDDRLKHWTRLTVPALAEKGRSRTEVLWLNPRSVSRQQLSLFEA